MSLLEPLMACSITIVILLQAGPWHAVRQRRPHALACLTYAGTSGTAHISVVIYLAIDKKLTSQDVLVPARACSALRQDKDV